MSAIDHTSGFAIGAQVREVARVDPSRVALVHARRRPGGSIRYERHTYAELAARADALAAGLHTVGVTSGTRCSFMVPPGFDALVLAVALWQVGAVIVGIEPHSHGLRAVRRCLGSVDPEVFFGTLPAHAGRLAFGWGTGAVRTNVLVGGWPRRGLPTLARIEQAGAHQPAVPVQVAPDDLAVVAFTTGSTGAPKPTELRHRNLSAMIDLVTRHWGLTDGRAVVDMVTFPMFWIIGLSVGGTVVVPPMNFTTSGPAKANPAALSRTIAECGVRSMFASPALLARLADHADPEDRSLASIERITAGGAEIHGPLFERVKRVLPPTAEMYSDYGATEALPVAEIAGAAVLEQTWRATEAGAGICAGPPLPGVEVRIIATHDGPLSSIDQADALPTGQIGELIARSGHISEAYHHQPDADVAHKIADADGTWHRLGDTGYLDGDGRIWLCGRRSHVVVSDVGTLYPLCCEPVFNTHRAVARSALVGVEEAGRVVPVIAVERAAIEIDESALQVQLRVLADTHEATRAIQRIVFVDELPVDRRHNAKIDRPLLARELAQRSTGRARSRT